MLDSNLMTCLSFAFLSSSILVSSSFSKWQTSLLHYYKSAVHFFAPDSLLEETLFSSPLGIEFSLRDSLRDERDLVTLRGS